MNNRFRQGDRMRKIRVFMSSSLSELECEREIAHETINELNMEPVMFEQLPAINKNLESAYLDEIKDSNIFVAILWKDLSEAVEKECNTAIELGIPTLLLVKTITHHESRTEGLEKFLRGNIESELNRGFQYVPFRKKFRTLLELKKELKEGLMNLVSTRFTEPALTSTSIENTWKIALNIIKNAKRRLLLFVGIPQMLLPLRPYDSEQKNYLEEDFLKTLNEWIDLLKQDERRRFLYLYSEEHAKEEISKHNLQDIFEKNLKKYKNIENQTKGRFEISSIQEFPGQILVGDNTFGIQFRAPKEKVISIFRQDPSIADNLFESFREYKARNTT